MTIGANCYVSLQRMTTTSTLRIYFLHFLIFPVIQFLHTKKTDEQIYRERKIDKRDIPMYIIVLMN